MLLGGVNAVAIPLRWTHNYLLVKRAEPIPNAPSRPARVTGIYEKYFVFINATHRSDAMGETSYCMAFYVGFRGGDFCNLGYYNGKANPNRYNKRTEADRG